MSYIIIFNLMKYSENLANQSRPAKLFIFVFQLRLESRQFNGKISRVKLRKWSNCVCVATQEMKRSSAGFFFSLTIRRASETLEVDHQTIRLYRSVEGNGSDLIANGVNPYRIGIDLL